jgi:hypothetical protein
VLFPQAWLLSWSWWISIDSGDRLPCIDRCFAFCCYYIQPSVVVGMVYGCCLGHGGSASTVGIGCPVLNAAFAFCFCCFSQSSLCGRGRGLLAPSRVLSFCRRVEGGWPSHIDSSNRWIVISWYCMSTGSCTDRILHPRVLITWQLLCKRFYTLYKIELISYGKKKRRKLSPLY